MADAVTNGPAIFSDDKGGVDNNSPRLEDLELSRHKNEWEQITVPWMISDIQ